MSSKLCALCIQRRVSGKNTFCSECYFGNQEFIDKMLKEIKETHRRPKWLMFLEADTEKEKRRLEKERALWGQNWNE